MSVSTLLAKEAQHRGYRMRIAGIRYYWTSSPNVPALTDPAGGSLDYVRVDGALKGIPRTLPMKTHPLKMPQVLSTTIEFLDVDGRLTEIWATEQESPITQLTADLAAAAVTATVLLGPASIGLTAFPSSGLLYIDNETIQYTGKGVLSFTGLVRGKYHSDDVAHDEYHLASNQLSREVYGFIPHLWFREVVLECFDMETAHLGSPVSEVLARGFLQEPSNEPSTEVFKIRIVNYMHQLKKQAFLASSGKATLSRELRRNLPDPIQSGFETVELYVNPIGTQETDAESIFTTNANMPAIDNAWMPLKLMYILVGSPDDGEVMAYDEWNYDSAKPENSYLDVVRRGVAGTRLGKTGGTWPYVWPQGTPVQVLCGIVGTPYFQANRVIDRRTRIVELVGAMYSDPQFAGVNPIEALLMLLTSTGLGTNGAYDKLPARWGLGVDAARVDLTVFAAFQTTYCSGRNHAFFAKEPEELLQTIFNELQVLYGALIYAKYDGTITIAKFRTSLPNDSIRSIPLADILEFDQVGVLDVYNTLKVEYDQFPGESPSTENAYDYRRRDALGESPAPGVISKSLRGKRFPSLRSFDGENIVFNQVFEFLQLLGNGAPMVQMLLNAQYSDMYPGEFGKFTHPAPPRITADARGFVDQLAMVLEVESLDDEAQVRIKAIVLRERRTCLWAPSAEIATVAGNDDFTISLAVFNNNDRQTAFWDVDTKIRVWDADMITFDQEEIFSFNAGTGRITLKAGGSAKVVVGHRITWDDWDTCRAGGATQQERALAAEWYMFFGDANKSLGAADDPAKEWL